jgi:predicted RNase H-like HicB family nuclease
VTSEAKRTIDYDVRFPYTVEIRYDEESDWPWFARAVELLGCMTGARHTLKENYENARGVAPQ